MGMGCKLELVMYTKCLVQFQKSTFLCKIPKLEMMDCYKRNPNVINLLINKYD